MRKFRVRLLDSGSAQGNGSAQAPPAPAPRAARPRVLVVPTPPARPGGPWDLAVYAEGRQADVCIAVMLAGLPETELLREAYLEACLPYRFRDLYLPRNLCAAAAVESRSAEQELERRENLRVLRELRSLQTKD